ncbi:hypothetical protein SPRG_03691 [Saprolegnia parasitica CBS 223.65]|uniref:Single-strand DNA deaminase toxin A-like C-terminal domain-containing protein n=1 Tax=Saprolegnia parasitica (strain CBS 223.65) TaxID=695850 RepID=A0A067CZ38_SAPPC|nr:hypothetical protein SPRG_03691 [Saprolegnia parasitica CBS 223.65]KDO31771.1 hypothetical protein SPRG_03691 [Saprolegnia parasitica CBS 223.65]|eukprot:XP_012197651.1 hypothetical protein SPRG_03691 [Saprolegnia parasitica CBS 223.65]
MSSAPSTYYTFASFLGPDVAATYLALPPLDQIAHFEAYLAYLTAQQVQFPTSKRATKCHAELRAPSRDDLPLLQTLLDGATISGFGVCGSPGGFLAQQPLSLGAAYLATEVRHAYVVENPKVLNSRSFMFGWCHAEKQKLVDLHEKLKDAADPRVYWRHVSIVVDRAMCADCIGFVSAYAKHFNVDVYVKDPACERQFQASGIIRDAYT